MYSKNNLSENIYVVSLIFFDSAYSYFDSCEGVLEMPYIINLGSEIKIYMMKFCIYFS